jgi:hypothetical protein
MKISIPKPCSEDWSQMTASEKGRFCASCQTQVVSFVGMQAKEIKDILEQETGSSCGRFSTHQLEAFNAAYQELPSPSILRNWTMAAVLAGVSVLPSFAQDNSPSLAASLFNTNISYNYYQTETTEIIPASDTVVLAGQVIGLDNNEALPFAQVIVAGTKIGATTNLDGKFMLKVPKSKEAITLEVHYIGYTSISHAVVPDSTQTDLVLNLHQDHMIMGMIGGVIIVSKKEQNANKRAHKKALREERKRERADRGK